MSTIAVPRARPVSLPGQLGYRLRRGPLHLAIVAICLIWMVPTVGLLVSSFRPANLVSTTGWWTAFTPPFQFTLENYQEPLALPQCLAELSRTSRCVCMHCA